jgi:hypothetical protein
MPISNSSGADNSSSETVAVNRKALFEVLTALNGPPHLIRELQVIRLLPGPTNNPIDLLINQYNDVVKSASNGRTTNELAGEGETRSTSSERRSLTN